MKHTILLAEDDAVQRHILTTQLGKKLGYGTIPVENGREAIRRLKNSNLGDISAVLLDLDMPEMDGFETLAYLRQYRPDLPVLILTSNDDTATAVKAIRAGALDFIVKPVTAEKLDIALKNAIRMSTLTRDLVRLKRDKEGTLGFTDLIGHADGLADVMNYARKSALSDVPLLILGEVSTGKELLARAIHGESKRVGAPFVAVHCSALPSQSIESILFGEQGGAHTTHSRNAGKFRDADRGTIFLDDIHALSHDMQIKLLRVLQQGEIEPAGGGRPIHVNVRIISATDHDLKAEVTAGRFREDLYFRLNILAITMPPLRERTQDILPLANFFLQRFAALDGLNPCILTAGAQHYLTDYLWPGNMRELESLLHRALILCETGHIDRALLQRIHAADAAPGMSAGSMQLALQKPNGLPKTMDEIETEAMQRMLEYYQHNVTRAAEAMGMAKSTFYRKLKHRNSRFASE